MSRLTLVIVLLFNLASAQETQLLTFEQVVSATLENNLSVKTFRNETLMAENENTIGNAGMLPQLSFEASGNYANNTTNQDYASGLTVNRSGVVSNGINSGILLSWTIFDGLRMFATRSRLNEASEASQLSLKQEIENTIIELAGAYYELVKQKQQIMAIREAITIYEERLRIAETRLIIGKAAKTDLLQAKIDLNEQKSMLISSETIYRNTHARLNTLMGRPEETEFEVIDEINFNYSPAYTDLKSSVNTRNNSILLAEKNVNLAGYMKKEIEAMRYPALSVYSSYNFTRSTNQAGFVLLNQNLGFNAGFTLSWTLFNGLRTHTQVKNSELMIMNNKLILDNIKLRTSSELIQAWRRFEAAKQIMALEEESYGLARENMEISLERFKLGNMTTVEFKQTQISLQDIQTRLVNARYDAKIAETELMRLNGDLVK